MRKLSNEMKSLAGAGGRAALAVFAFAAITAWPLVAGAQRDTGTPAQVAHATTHDGPPENGQTWCRT